MLDRISVSVLQLRLEAIVQEMGEAMLRTAYSQILNSSRDFSTAVCDAAGRLTAQAEHVPIHVGAMPWACNHSRVLRRAYPARGYVSPQRSLPRGQSSAGPDCPAPRFYR